MAFIQYLTFDGVPLPMPDSYEVEMSDVEEDYHVLADKDIGYGFVIRGTVSEQG